MISLVLLLVGSIGLVLGSTCLHQSRMISLVLLLVGSIGLVLGSLLHSMATVDPRSLRSSLLVGSLHRCSDGSSGGGSSSLVASKLGSELLLGLLLGSIKCFLVLGVRRGKLGHR